MAQETMVARFPDRAAFKRVKKGPLQMALIGRIAVSDDPTSSSNLCLSSSNRVRDANGK
jgi:hypothetical protein